MTRVLLLSVLALTLSCDGCDSVELDVITRLLAPSVTTLDFGSVYVGADSQRTLAFTSLGTGPAVLADAVVSSVDPSGAFDVVDAPLGQPLPRDTVGELTLRFAPGEAGDVDEELLVTSDADNQGGRFTIVLRGVGLAPLECDDDNGCTDESFDPVLGECRRQNNADLCDDDNACTLADRCDGGACVGTAVVCAEPAVACVTAACVADRGCVEFPDDNACGDDDRCTTDRCDVVDGCTHGAAPDGTPCGSFGGCDAIDLCIAATCTSFPVPDGAPCSDGDLCTTGDACAGGTCGGTPTTTDPIIVSSLSSYGRPSRELAPQRAAPLGGGDIVIWDEAPGGAQVAVARVDDPSVLAVEGQVREVRLLSSLPIEGAGPAVWVDARDDVVAVADSAGALRFFSVDDTEVTARDVLNENSYAAVVVGVGVAFACTAGLPESALFAFDLADLDNIVTLDARSMVGSIGCTDLDLDDDGQFLVMVNDTDLGPDLRLFDVSANTLIERSFLDGLPQHLARAGGGLLATVEQPSPPGETGNLFLRTTETFALAGVNNDDCVQPEARAIELSGASVWIGNASFGVVDVARFPLALNGCTPALSRHRLGFSVSAIRLRGDDDTLLISASTAARGVDLLARDLAGGFVNLGGPGLGLLGPIEVDDDGALLVLGPQRVHEAALDALALRWTTGSGPAFVADVVVDSAQGLAFPMRGTRENPRTSVFTSELTDDDSDCVCDDCEGCVCDCDGGTFLALLDAAPGAFAFTMLGALSSDGPRLFNARTFGFGGAHEFAVTDVVDLAFDFSDPEVIDLGVRFASARGTSELQNLRVVSMDIDGDVGVVAYRPLFDDGPGGIVELLRVVGPDVVVEARSDRLRTPRMVATGPGDRVAVVEDTTLVILQRVLTADATLLVELGSVDVPGIVSVAIFDGPNVVVTTETGIAFLRFDVDGLALTGALSTPSPPTNAIAQGDRIVVSTPEALHVVSPPCPP